MLEADYKNIFQVRIFVVTDYASTSIILIFSMRRLFSDSNGLSVVVPSELDGGGGGDNEEEEEEEEEEENIDVFKPSFESMKSS